MRIDQALDSATLTLNQHFFMASWYNLCHENSIDSDRLSLSTPGTVASELLALYAFESHFGGPDKRREVGRELLSLLEHNQILEKAHYGTLKNDLMDQLRDVNDKKTSTDHISINKYPPLVKSLLKEFLLNVETSYVADAFDALEEAIANPNSDASARKSLYITADRLAGALLSTGASIRDLHAYYRFILNKRNDNAPFNHKFRKFREAATATPAKHKVTFYLRSNVLEQMLGQQAEIQFGGFDIRMLPNQENRKPRFSAEIELDSPTLTIAGSHAYEKLNDAVDTLDYTLGNDQIEIEKHYESKESEGIRSKRFDICRQVPNPNNRFSQADFTKFTEAVGTAVQGDGIRSAKLLAVFRSIRIAQSTDNIESKLITYWSALETIARDSVQHKGQSLEDIIIQAALPCLKVDYVNKRLKAYLATFHDLIEDNELPLVGGAGKKVSEISSREFLEALADDATAQAILEKANAYPYFHYQLSRFSQRCRSIEKMSDALNRHGEKVSQQIKRVYRARNLITHQAERVNGIELLCAHLEHYLQTCILSMIDMMHKIPSLKSPEEFFTRYRYEVKKMERNKNQPINFDKLGQLIELHWQ